MDEIAILIAKARNWSGQRLALATVVETWGSAPRPRGSHMLVHEDGRFEGSVSGGCVEGDILVAASEVIATGAAQMKSFGLTDDDVWAVGIPCGGTITILVQPVAPGGFPAETFDAIDAARAAGRTLSVATDTATGRSTVGEGVGDFVNRYLPPRRLLIVGAVQIAQRLAALVRPLGTTTVVIDPRERFLTAERFPDVARDDRWPDLAVAAHAPDASTALVTLSHDPKIDDPALIAALAAPTGYVAALGSTRSHAARRERLAAAGVAQADFDRIHGPAGLPINAIGPAEIALSIAAGMVKTLNARD